MIYRKNNQYPDRINFSNIPLGNIIQFSLPTTFLFIKNETEN